MTLLLWIAAGAAVVIAAGIIIVIFLSQTKLPTLRNLFRSIMRILPVWLRKVVWVMLGKMKDWNTVPMRPSGPQLDGLIDLAHYIQQALPQPIRMVEIGCYQGESTQIFLDTIPDIQITGIDPFINGYDDNDGTSYLVSMSRVEARFDAVVQKANAKAGGQRVTKIKDFSTACVDRFADHSLDFLYIDGEHTYEGVKTDIKNWKSKVRPGGIIAGHDYGTWQGVTNAVREAFGKEPVAFRDSSWLFVLPDASSERKP
jgi:hypothetical protein